MELAWCRLHLTPFNFSGLSLLYDALFVSAPQQSESVMCTCVLSYFSRVQLFVTPWTVARQAPLSKGFSRQEYWSRLPCPPPGDLPHQGMKPTSLMSPTFAGASLPLAPPRKPVCVHTSSLFRFPSRLGHQRALSRTPCVMQELRPLVSVLYTSVCIGQTQSPNSSHPVVPPWCP